MSKEIQNPFDEQGQVTEATEEKPVQSIAGEPAKQDPVRRFKRVKFHSKSDKNQPNDVVLSVNGHTLLLKRDMPVVLPEPFLIAADNATYNQYQTGSGSRKVIAKVRRYPYDMLGDATEEEYQQMLSDGSRKQAEARERDEAVQVIR